MEGIEKECVKSPRWSVRQTEGDFKMEGSNVEIFTSSHRFSVVTLKDKRSLSLMAFLSCGGRPGLCNQLINLNSESVTLIFASLQI